MPSTLSASFSRLARQPLFQFLLIGGVFGALFGLRGERDSEVSAATLRVSAGDISRLEAEWQARWRRPPTEAELDGLIQALVRETALYREALAMGLDQDDPVIRRVLVQKLEGIARDLVELSLAPTDQELEAYFAENAERYRPPAEITFTHVFVDPDRRGDRTLDDAAEMLVGLRALDPPTEGADEFGDPFMLQRYFPAKPEFRIASLFGREFAQSVFELEPGRWHGPVLSGYGTHLVYVERLEEAPLPTLDEVRERVTQEWVVEKREEITDEYFAGVLSRYEVTVEREPSGEPGTEPREAAPEPTR